MSRAYRTSRRQFLGVAGGAVAAGSLLGPASAGAASRAGSAPPPGRGQKFYFVSGNINDPYYIDVNAGLKLADQWFGTKSKLTGTPDVNIQNIVQTIETLIGRPDTKGLIVPTLDAKSYLPVFEDAAKKKIPVVTYNVDTTGPRVGFLGPSDEQLISKATDVMGAKLSGKGKVAFVAQIVAQQDLRNRGVMFQKFLKERYPGIKFVGSYNYNGKPEDAVRTVDAILTKNQDLAGLFWGDGSGGPAAPAIHSRAPKLQLLLDDTVQASLKAVKAGQAFACLGQSTFDTTFYCAQALYIWNTGVRVPDTQYMAQAVVTADTVDAFMKNPYRHPPGAVTA
jgi:ribose transport system substrate-binding protein